MACHSAQYHEHRSYQCIGLRGQVTPQNHYETLLQHQLAALTSRNHAVADAAIRAKCLQQALLKGFYKMHEEKCIFLFSLILKQGFSGKCRSQRRERTCFHTKFHGWFIKSILNVPKTPLKFLENRSNGCPFTLFWASLCMTGSIAKTPEERLSKEERFITILVFFMSANNAVVRIIWLKLTTLYIVLRSCWGIQEPDMKTGKLGWANLMLSPHSSLQCI